MSDKTVDEVASAIWQKGYNAGYNAQKDAEYRRGYLAALQQLDQWAGPADSEAQLTAPDLGASATMAFLEQAERMSGQPRKGPNQCPGPDASKSPTAARAWKWLRNRPDGASHTDWMESGQATDHAAPWRLARSGWARQDPKTRRYYAVDKVDVPASSQAK